MYNLDILRAEGVLMMVSLALLIGVMWVGMLWWLYGDDAF